MIASTSGRLDATRTEAAPPESAAAPVPLSGPHHDTTPQRAVTAARSPTPGRLRVMVCDDHDVYRLGLRSLLAEVDDMDLVAETTDPGQALMLAYRLSPDVMLVGEDLTGGMLDLVRRLGGYDTEVLVLADSAARADLVGALRAGARGYLTRRAAPVRLLDGIRAVARRETAVDSAVAGHLLPYLDDPATPGREAPVVLTDRLTSRQRVVACLVAEGLSNAEIARRLYVSQATVKSHLTLILRRLHLRDRTQLAIMVNRGTTLGSP